MTRLQLVTATMCCVVSTGCGGSSSSDPFGAEPASAGGTAGDSSSGGLAHSPESGGASAAGAGGSGGAGGASSTVQGDLSHTFATMTIGPGEEITDLCQSWTIGNDASLFVNRIEASNRGGLHHSNWIWVPESQYAGPDGVWPCAERGFDQVLAGAAGGVFFAQSTQSLTDTQAFPPGVAFEVPPRARIVGDLHLLNTSAQVLETDVDFEIFTLPPEEVVVPLQPMAFTNLALDIAPLTKTEAHMQCATPQPDFDVYYVLPHYHELGTSMRIDVAGGPMDGTPLFGSAPGIGEPWGQSFDPPFAVRGSVGLGITCAYDNPRSVTVRYGTGDQEMCVALLYTSGTKAGGRADLNLSTTEVGGTHVTDGLCLAIGL